MMTRNEFRQWCDASVRILDGATGTELIKQGMPAGVCPELWVLEHPESITRVQQSYAGAGSDIVYTATFGGNAVKLADLHGVDVPVMRCCASLLRALDRKRYEK